MEVVHGALALDAEELPRARGGGALRMLHLRAPGVSIASPQRLRVTGSVLRSRMVDAASPVAYGYSDKLAIFCANGPIFTGQGQAINAVAAKDVQERL